MMLSSRSERKLRTSPAKIPPSQASVVDSPISAEKERVSPPRVIASSRIGIEALLFFIPVLVVYIASPVVSSSDSHFVLPTALSILRHGNADIDEYHEQFSEASWAVTKVNGHFWSAYPIGVPFLVVPLAWTADKVAAMFGTDLEAAAIRKAPLLPRSNHRIRLLSVLELIFASLITAAAAALLFYYVRGRLSLPKSLLLAGLFAFGTSAYSTASRGLWQHGPSMLLLISAVLVYERLPRWRAGGAVLLGTIAGYSYGVRPANVAAIIGYAVLLTFTGRRWLIPYLGGALVGVAPLFAFHWTVYGGWFSYYYGYTQTGLLQLSVPVKPFLATLISPSRGLFVFSPFLLLIFLRLSPSYWRRYKASPLEILLVAISLAWCVGLARWSNWWGGGSFGPRMLCDLLPFLIIFLIPVLENWSLNIGGSRRLFTVLLLVSGTISVAIHTRGATSMKVWEWNDIPMGIDYTPKRVWSWRDPQFLRGILGTSESLISPNTPLMFYAIRSCRILDTRLPVGTFGGPGLAARKERQIPIPEGSCGVPHGGGAYSLNLTVIPRGPLDWLNAWETGEPMPLSSVLNAGNSAITANAAIVRAGNGGSISVLASSDTDLVIDITGYFAPMGR